MEQRFTWTAALLPVPGQPGSPRLVLRRVPVPASSSSTPVSPPGSPVRSDTQFTSNTTDVARKEQRRKTLAALSEVVKARPPKRASTEAPEAGPSKSSGISFKLWSEDLPGCSTEDGVESRPGVQVRYPEPAATPGPSAPQRCPRRVARVSRAAPGRGLPKAALAPSAAPGPGSLKAALPPSAASGPGSSRAALGATAARGQGPPEAAQAPSAPPRLGPLQPAEPRPLWDIPEPEWAREKKRREKT
ncbi:osteocalcin 2-like [Xyrichtys novacula]|uniref:Osteocalcin 2-like n=1 Tax=Xyrichtys novacula TaxID=13765 RepID=A0AAV1F314_XYRNO|nr:osteocalcin 2-like [Xyrichtys novacula]